VTEDHNDVHVHVGEPVQHMFIKTIHPETMSLCSTVHILLCHSKYSFDPHFVTVDLLLYPVVKDRRANGVFYLRMKSSKIRWSIMSLSLLSY